MHHDVLAPVSGLTRLLSLDLTNNPLYSAPRHRDTASSWLNPGLATLNPSLDRRHLSRAELLQVGSSRLVISPQVSPSRPVTEEEEELQSVSPSWQEDLQSVSCEGSLVSVSTVSRKKRRRRRKVREVVITDESDYTTATTETEPEVKTDKTEKSEVTETLQDLREKYGDNWLRSGASETLHSLLGIEQSQADTETNTAAIIQNMVEVEVERERQQTQGNYQTKEEDLTDDISAKSTTEDMQIISRRSSDEVPDAIDKFDDLNCGVELEGDITSRLADTEVKAEAKVSVGSDNFYSSNSEREREASPSDKSCKVIYKFNFLLSMIPSHCR